MISNLLKLKKLFVPQKKDEYFSKEDFSSLISSFWILPRNFLFIISMIGQIARTFNSFILIGLIKAETQSAMKIQALQETGLSLLKIKQETKGQLKLRKIHSGVKCFRFRAQIKEFCV